MTTMRTSSALLLVGVLVCSCDPSREERRQKFETAELEEKRGWLRTETNPDLLHAALRAVVFYCQQRGVELACLELQYQLVWGARQVIDLIAEHLPIEPGGWGEIPEVAWRVALQKASVGQPKRAYLQTLASYHPTEP